MREPDLFQMVFIDAKLPDIEGLDLARRFREIDSNLHIIMISGYFYRDDEDIQKAIEKGLICGFIGKPFIHEEILKTINALT